MQEISVNIQFHDIRQGEKPPKDGWYLTKHYTPFNHMGLMPMYWKDDKKAWFICPEDDRAFEPNEFTDYMWTDYFLEGVEC